MILGFMQHFPWKGEDKQPVPTNFREKILAGAGKEIALATSGEKFILNSWPEISPNQFNPKLHTFREDKHDRWKAGMSIQMVYRGPKYSILDHFNKNIPELQKCVSTQKISIKHRRSDLIPASTIIEIRIDGDLKFILPINSNMIVTEQYRNGMTIINNDGFNTFNEFASWFNKDWSGKIIHWTDLRY